LLAAVWTCIITGIWSSAQIYLAQLSWPDWSSLVRGLPEGEARNSALDTAIMAVAHRIGGPALDLSLTVILMLASIGSGITAQIGASRLLYGMGRDGIIPKSFFGHLDKKYSTPNYNIILIGTISLFGALLLNYEECARLINFGAFFAFMTVNIAALREYYFRKRKKSFKSFWIDFLPPAMGFLICFFIWLNLPVKTFIIGGCWMLGGIIYLAVRTKGFQKQNEPITLP
jgi:amino acid transporter